MHSLGINIGSTSIKLVMLEGESILWSEVLAHDGNFQETLIKMLSKASLPSDLQSLATGTEGRFLVNINNVIESVCIEEALKHLNKNVDAVVSMGGEDLILYTINKENKIVTSFSGNKCASGTGEFFKQQLGRMDMTLNDVARCGTSHGCSVKPLSARCSVFMKSDCTHKLNKGEATKGDIVLSLSDVMASKVIDFIKRAGISEGRVMLAGGVTKNIHIVDFIKERFPSIEVLVPEQAPYFEAYGAALLAKNYGTVLPEISTLIKSKKTSFDTFKPLKDAENLVEYIPSKRGKAKKGGEYILGVDGGSTTTKACLIDVETSEVVAAHYGRTHGDPVEALKKCIVELEKQLNEQGLKSTDIKITLASTTGSSREILGVFLETPAIYNEIIAHAVGTTFYDEKIDTIFEIGGQDAKYALIKNKVPIDYAMNEACSAGTGSFIEESASGDLNIKDCTLIGDVAVRAENPLKFGEHCSAFINSDIRKAIQQGAKVEDITAGIVASIVSNYLNRVVGNRTIGNYVVLQGGVAKNKAIPLAFALLLNKNILVPPDPELMGCFGVGVLAKQKFAEGLLQKSEFLFAKILETKIVSEGEFKCKACENYCPIKILNVNEHKYMFGGRCNKYANMRKKKQFDNVHDYVAERYELLFNECAPNPSELEKKKEIKVGIPKAFSVHTLWPLYSWFFHDLGVETVLSKNVSHEGIAKMESSYCFPAEIAHGAVQDIIDHKADYIFLPQLKNLPSYESKVHATFCPITQALPYYIKKAFPELEKNRILAPVIKIKSSFEDAANEFLIVGEQLGFSESDIKRAFKKGIEKQREFFAKASKMGRQALEEARKENRPVIAILGRPYNAFTSEANMGIPRKFTSRGYSVIPYDILPFEGEEIFDNMYWYYGQQDMKTTTLIKKEDNIYLTWISNFSCAPDSFMLHYIRWIMGTKPFLILELDSHSADAGVDTRVEAFLDIIEGYKSKISELKEEKYDNGYRFINEGKDIYIKNIVTNTKIEVRDNPKVKLLLSNMGNLTTKSISAAVASTGIHAVALPVPDIHVLQLARNFASGKECVPSLLVLGNALQFLVSEHYKKDEIYLLFVPITTGPCRTGQYYVFYENLFRDMRIDNVVVFILSSDNSYTELGPDFSKKMWWGGIIADYMRDIEVSLRACAVDPKSAIEKYDLLIEKLIDTIEHKSDKELIPSLENIAKELSTVPLKQQVKDSPKVLVVGEVYVRRDDFAVDELIQHFSQKGIVSKISGFTEWIYYCDFVREKELKIALAKLPIHKRYFSKEFKKFVLYKIEQKWKHYVDNKVKQALSGSNLIPSAPHDMYKIMANTKEHFVPHELHSEISVSSGSAATAMLEDYSGVVNISPFACLIGRVIEGLITPWFRERQYPVISIEIDGNQLPPGVITKLEIFMLNVLRFKNQGADVSKLISSSDEQETTTINRKQTVKPKIVRDLRKGFLTHEIEENESK